MPRLPLLDPAALSPELRAMLEKWQADGGDPNFILTLARLPETLARFVAFRPASSSAGTSSTAYFLTSLIFA